MSTGIESYRPERPLIWPDFVYDLQESFEEDEVYIVGGAVRDAYLHHPIKDLDIVTPDGAIKLARKIADMFSGDVYVMDTERDVARVLLHNLMDGDLQIDVSGLRGETLFDDLLDRDFTINAIAVDLRSDLSAVLDPLHGIDDVKKRIIRRCSAVSIKNDPLRCLRAIRISVQLNMRIEPETIKDIRQQVARLSEISSERSRDEFFKILELNKPVSALRVAYALGSLTPLFPQMKAVPSEVWNQTLVTLEKLNLIYHTIGPKRTDNITNVFDMGMFVVGLDRYRQKFLNHLNTILTDHRSLATLSIFSVIVRAMVVSDSVMAHAFRKSAEQIAVSFRLSNAEVQYLSYIVDFIAGEWEASLFDPDKPITDLDLHRFWFEYQTREAGVSIGLLVIALFLGQAGNTLNQDEWINFIERVQKIFEAYFDRYEQIVAPPQIVDGATLQSTLQLKRGPIIGQLLTAIREAQVVGDVHTPEDAIAYARRWLDDA